MTSTPRFVIFQLCPGTKGSSYGPREQGGYAKEFYTTVKTAYVRG